MGGFSIGYGIGISPRTAAFDADALAYFATAGITDSTAQIQINDFVKGVKDLGLWSSMVSWPLRSSQNAGTGTTAYSLGGLGTYNATLANGPTWGADGIILDGINDNIRSSSIVENQSMVFGFVNNCNVAQADKVGAFASDSSASQTEIRLRPTGKFLFHSNSSWGAAYDPAFSISGFGFYCLNFNKTNSTAIVSRNSTFSASQTRTLVGTTSNKIWFGSTSQSEQAAAGTFSFGFYIKSETSSSSVESLYSLYKDSLGDGLGLP